MPGSGRLRQTFIRLGKMIDPDLLIPVPFEQDLCGFKQG
jgi:hypothetical protein